MRTCARVVLVEGRSDQAALAALEVRRGRDLRGEGVAIVPGRRSDTVGRSWPTSGPTGSACEPAGLCDVGEVGAYRRAVQRAGLGPEHGPADPESLGIHVCVTDLEDELIRGPGADAVVQVIEAQGELRSLRTLQQQPAQRGRTIEAHLHRFMGSKGGRKLRYARLLVEALDLDAVPAPARRGPGHRLSGSESARVGPAP